ncbi:MAG: DUF6941 family protein [Longimicrobiales bacterium]
MEVVLAALCDSANISTDGKLNVLGVFDLIQADAFPAHQASMSFAFRMRAEYEDQGRASRVEVTLMDSDGRRLWGGSVEVVVGAIAPGEFAHISQVLRLDNVQFRSAGRYRFRIQVGDQGAHDTVFRLAKRKPRDP